MAGEYRAKASIYEIPERVFREMFELEGASAGLEVMGGKASLPVGPAAGPNSQIAPNVVAAYLAGSRVFELKTVQENDSLDIEKPCIDALDEGHNVEWSTELSLADARGEYLRAWMAVNLLAAIWSPRPRDFIFNISVGYTLDGIRGSKVDEYLEGMRKPGLGPSWASDLSALSRFVEGQAFRAAFGSEAAARAGRLLDAFPADPVHSVTLSTMHGCPPAEIERIGRYLIEEKGFDVYVKLNPTLLGYDRARAILDETGWKDILLKRESFEHDLQWKDALSLIAALRGSASTRGRRFGIKLSNTLANDNTGGRLPGGERYMSGRALFPITARLAADLATALPDFGQRFSYCGGVSALNAYELIRAGVGPLTVATDVLKPGGYLRFASMARAAVAALPASARVPDASRLANLAEESLGRPEYRKGFKDSDSHIAKPLPLFDCFAAPCIEACPARQKVPEYLRRAAHAAEAANLTGDSAAGNAGAAGGAVAAGDASVARAAWAEALATIVADNPLPRITGVLCDHACQGACSRLDYEGSVHIRDVKLACSRSGEVPVRRPEAEPFKGRAAVIGAGPAGLACAWYLSLWGAPVTVFDGSADAGGVPADVIPRFRITRDDLASDIERIKGLGAAFHFGKRITNVADLGAAAKGEPFTAVFLASGAPVARRLELAGEGPARIDALSFLSEISAAEGRSAKPPFVGANHIAVAGGGNTAMDAVRAALRLPGIEKVSLLYRRTMAEMPADKEETAAALAEGAVLEELALPEAASKDAAGKARLRVRRMKLGEKDASGRRSPLASDETFELDCDLLVEALGEACDASFMKAFGVEVGRDGRPVIDPETKKTRSAAAGGNVGISAPAIFVGGDAARGPASIIAACADGKKAAYAILRAGGVEPVDAAYSAPAPDAAQLATRGKLAFPLEGEEGSPDFVIREAERCLECDSACLRCVEVCPNRANIAIPTGDGAAGRQAFQILHVDSLCNECGNCGFFCPWEGEPFRGKPALFATKADLEASRNAGFAILLSGHGETDARPGLAFRALPEGPVSALSYEEWGLEDAPRGATSPEAAAMAALAAVVLKDHPYLVSGGRS
jgi:putative selenate reductase